MRDIISCSRRTDIPAIYYKWLQERLKEKKVTLLNSYNNQPYTIDLSPEIVHSIVLWSKNYENLIKDPGLLKDYNLYFQFTINGYGSRLEPNIPNLKSLIYQVGSLAETYSPEQISWRFDPIIFCENAEIIPSTNYFESRLHTFRCIAKALAKSGVNKCTFSFISVYGKVQESLDAKNIVCEDITGETQIKFAKKMVEIAKPLNIQLYSCCGPLVETVEGVNKSRCVDGHLLQQLFGIQTSKAKDQSQRLTCGCTKSKDIGSYTQRCSHKCVYCYANPSSYTSK